MGATASTFTLRATRDAQDEINWREAQQRRRDFYKQAAYGLVIVGAVVWLASVVAGTVLDLQRARRLAHLEVEVGQQATQILELRAALEAMRR